MRRKETKEQISRRMALIRGKWTLPERQAHGYLKAIHARHRMHPSMPAKELGHPDIAISGTRTVILAHGCFWHLCPACGRDLSRMKEFWRDKVTRNAARDERQLAALRASGWDPVVVWEHDFRNGRYKEILREAVASAKRDEAGRC